MSQIRILSLSECDATQRRSVEGLKRAQADSEYLEEHWGDLLQQHPDEWVAIFKGAVAGHAADLDALLRELESSGIDSSRAVVELLSTETQLFVL